MKRLQIHGPHGNIINMDLLDDYRIKTLESGFHIVNHDGYVYLRAILTTANFIITPILETTDSADEPKRA